ncbi:MAG TPA: YigZ family protein [Flavisolibacter sp.]|nr:YigZ family protein [Flavisolibacter sp.]
MQICAGSLLSQPLMNHYNTIEKPSQAEYKDRGSRFLAYAFPVQTVDEFKKGLKALKEEHPKAAHHCFAYRLGTDGNNFRVNDDGEPSGSAGKPILGQIDSKNLSNTAVVVVRYFGGTLLGVPGLINAYKTATSLALQLTPIVEKPVLVSYELQFDYTLMNEVMIFVKRYHCVVLENEMQLFCRMVIGVPKAEEAVFADRIGDLHGVEVRKV